MKSPNARRFTIADVMILVVAVAVASACLKAYLPGHELEMRLSQQRRPASTRVRISEQVQNVQTWVRGPGSCIVVPLMVATLAFRLRQPRPRFRRIARQPGFAACLAAVLSLIPGAFEFVMARNRKAFIQRSHVFDLFWQWMIYWPESAVMGAWLMLILSRSWRASADWVDRLGRMLGAYWILLFAIAVFRVCLWKLSL